MTTSPTLVLLYLTLSNIVIVIKLVNCTSSDHNYLDALSKSILFFEGQRSGWLPLDQRLNWRANSGLGDGSSRGIDLVGGYYDAGDNVKFNFPMAFTTTMLAWSVIEFSEAMPPYELRNALVGDPIKDHNCWERPEDMDTARTVYSVEAPNSASDVAGETAAALAASSMAFRRFDPGYAETLLRNAERAFEYADTYKGLTATTRASGLGCARSTATSTGTRQVDMLYIYIELFLEAFRQTVGCDGWASMQDELLWGAAWLRRASQNDTFLNYIQNNGKTLGAEDTVNEFGWDNKHAGLNVLVSKEFLEGNVYSLQSYKESADSFMCTLIPSSSSSHIEITPGGMIYKPGGSNMQHVTSIAFLLLVYANYLARTSQTVNCGSIMVGPASLRQQAKAQIDYILGDNPMGLSYMVGYGPKYPQRIHHRGSSLPSVRDHPEPIACKAGTGFFNSSGPNPNVLVGAVVGGPGEDDVYEDDRADFRKSEPTTYINAPLVGALAYFVANPS
ncbi:hypothetical protein Scep_020538 [Stephania cephalantha]|uniref:Endoglucanase n=1 Tax=Stephania cephalantha TaxID=152367 RepID=A0AAP0NP31_9MAGN